MSGCLLCCEGCLFGVKIRPAPPVNRAVKDNGIGKVSAFLQAVGIFFQNSAVRFLVKKISELSRTPAVWCLFIFIVDGSASPFHSVLLLGNIRSHPYRAYRTNHKGECDSLIDLLHY